MSDDELDKCANQAASAQAIGGTVDFLNLLGCRTFAVEQVEHILVVRASYDNIPPLCPKCHASDLAVDNETKDWLIWDAPHCGLHPTLIQLFVPSGTCLACNLKIKIEPPWLDYSPLQSKSTVTSRRPSRTLRLIEYFLDRITCLVTFDQIGLDTCQSPDAIKEIFLQRFEEWDKHRLKDLPISMGIDELKHRVKSKKNNLPFPTEHTDET
jgi:hypothetical protein